MRYARVTPHKSIAFSWNKKPPVLPDRGHFCGTTSGRSPLAGKASRSHRLPRCTGRPRRSLLSKDFGAPLRTVFPCRADLLAATEGSLNGEKQGTFVHPRVNGLHYYDYRMAKRREAFRRAALLLSTTAWLLCHILITMNIGQMIL